MKRPLFAAALIAALAGASCGGGASSTVTAPATKTEAASATTGSKPRDLETFMVLINFDLYRTKIVPAFDKYVNAGDASPLRELVAPGVEVPELSEKKLRLEAAQKMAPAVLEARCLVKLPGIDPYQLGGGGELVSYLYSASDWLRETLSSKDISDITLDYPLGEHTEIIRPPDAAEIRVNVRKIPAPEDAAIKKQLAALLTMMEAPEKNPKYALAMVMK